MPCYEKGGRESVLEGRWERGIVESEGECALNAGGRWELVFGHLSL